MPWPVPRRLNSSQREPSASVKGSTSMTPPGRHRTGPRSLHGPSGRGGAGDAEARPAAAAAGGVEGEHAPRPAHQLGRPEVAGGPARRGPAGPRPTWRQRTRSVGAEDGEDRRPRRTRRARVEGAAGAHDGRVGIVAGQHRIGERRCARAAPGAAMSASSGDHERSAAPQRGHRRRSVADRCRRPRTPDRCAVGCAPAAIGKLKRMAVVAASASPAFWDRAARRAPVGAALLVAAAVVALVAVAAMLRLRALSAPYWIDEGISVGISSHPLDAIPGVLRQDGSPPLYYLLLHVWIGALRLGPERDARAVGGLGHRLRPGRLVGGGALRDVGRPRRRRADGARSLRRPVRRRDADVLAAAAARAAGLRRLPARLRPAPPRRIWRASRSSSRWPSTRIRGARSSSARPAWRGWPCSRSAPRRRTLARDGVLAFGGAALLFAPWVPTLLYQAAHTGAPWSHRPTGRVADPCRWPGSGAGSAPSSLLLPAAAVGLAGRGAARRTRVAPRRAGRGRHRRRPRCSPRSPTRASGRPRGRCATSSWCSRPLALLVALGLGRLALLGPLAVLAACPLRVAGATDCRGARAQEQRHAGRPRARARAAARHARLLHPARAGARARPRAAGGHALRARRWARSPTPGVMDWRDALRAAATPLASPRSSDRRCAALRRGARLLLVQPVFSHPDSPWTLKIRAIARRWGRAVRRSRLLRRLRMVRPDARQLALDGGGHPAGAPVTAASVRLPSFARLPPPGRGVIVAAVLAAVVIAAAAPAGGGRRRPARPRLGRRARLRATRERAAGDRQLRRPEHGPSAALGARSAGCSSPSPTR